MNESLSEIEVAALLGYRKWTKFARDLREGRIPAPDRVDGHLKTWSRRKLQAWIEGQQLTEPTEGDLLERVKAG